MSLYRAYRLFIPVAALLLVTACGVKPGTLFSPSEWASANEAASEEVVEPVKKAKATKRSYPATYPDVRSDPPPPPVAVDHNLPPL